MAPDAALRLVGDDILGDPHGRAEKAALYGAEAVDAEIERRRAARLKVADLRGDDLPAPKDEWELRRYAEADAWDPIAAAGVGVSRPAASAVSAFDVEQRRRAQEKATARQTTRWAVAVGVTLRFKSGRVAREGDPITLEDIGVGKHSAEVMRALVGRRFVTEIDAHTAWLRSLPPHVGPYVVREPFELGGRRLEVGDSVSEHDFPAPPRVRSFAPEDLIADMTVAELEARIVAVLARHHLIGGLAVAPPTSAFHAAMSIGQIERAPNYDPSAPAPEPEAPPQATKRGVLSRIIGRKEQAK